MRIRAIAATAVVSGALALTGAAVPAAQAATHHGAEQQAQAAQRLFGRQAAPADDEPTVQVSNAKIAGGASFVSVGTTNTVHVPYSFTLTTTGVDLTSQAELDAYVTLYHGSEGINDSQALSDDSTCTPAGQSVSTATCTGTIDIYPMSDLHSDQAGPNFHAEVQAYVFNNANGTAADTDVKNLPAPGVQRYSKITAHASAKSVTRKHSVTVTGALTRANWDTASYGGYGDQTVKLQFRKAGSTTYTTIKTLRTDSHGNLKATATPTASGYWRYTFAATATTPSATATGYYVAVK